MYRIIPREKIKRIGIREDFLNTHTLVCMSILVLDKTDLGFFPVASMALCNDIENTLTFQLLPSSTAQSQGIFSHTALPRRISSLLFCHPLAGGLVSKWLRSASLPAVLNHNAGMTTQYKTTIYLCIH